MHWEAGPQSWERRVDGSALVDAQAVEKIGCCCAKVRLEWHGQGNVMTPTLANCQNLSGDFSKYADFWLCSRSTKSQSLW